MLVENHFKPLRPVMDPHDLEELLRQIALGSQQAFEELYRATDSAIYGYALSLMRNHHEAQDVMMDTYLKIRCAAHLYMPMGKPMAWILTITKNIARTKLRSAGRQIPLDDLEETTPSFDRDSEEAVALEQAMKVLGDQERQILILHAVTGLKHREIAEMLGMPLATVLSKYARSLKKLKKALEEDNFPNKEVQ
ncbi:MAG TPA: RNA polymerase sigma factor [Candidatus Negativibacillus faecipullorum]|nr:RNA polymerase sigma factor [Candidatus Negativibacillus faecipullorum]